MFSLSSDFLKEGQVLKAAKHRRLVCTNFEKMQSLNNYNRMKASDSEKKSYKSQSVHAFKPPN